MIEYDWLTAPPRVPDRPGDAHKGTFGTVVVVGGSPAMFGAPALTAAAALRTGCGLCKIVTDAALLPHVLTIEPSATGATADNLEIFAKQDTVVFAVGPGMGVGKPQRRRVVELLTNDRPVVLDADGLNNLARVKGLGSNDHPLRCTAAPLVLTPHPGEFARLAKKVDLSLNPTDPEERPHAAAELANRFDAIVVLKGQHTIVTDGYRMYRNESGNPALATAGSGDVLTGCIASLIAQGMAPCEAAALGVFIHGAAADGWAARFGPSGLTAKTLADLIPETMHAHRRSHP